MRRILLIEDDPDIASLVRIGLDGIDRNIETAYGGVEGLKSALSDTPAVIILDWMLPGLNGLDVCQQMRADPRLDGTPIIMLTAKAQEADVQRAFDAGADEYIIKPFSPRELASLVRARLDQGGSTDD